MGVGLGLDGRAVGGADWWKFAARLSARVTDGEARRWGSDPPRAWLEESRRVTLDPDLLYCRPVTAAAGGRCQPISGGRQLDAAYQERWEEIALQRITRAGVRLAALLSEGLQRLPAGRRVGKTGVRARRHRE